MLQIRVLVEFDHLLNNFIVVSIKVCVIIVDLRIIACFLDDPVLLFLIELPLELAIIFENGALCWIVVTVTNIVGAFRDFFWSTNVIGYQSQTIRTKAFKLLGIETAVLNCAVVPLLLSGDIISLCSEL